MQLLWWVPMPPSSEETSMGCDGGEPAGPGPVENSINSGGYSGNQLAYQLTSIV
jgi:hypothetical protein